MKWHKIPKFFLLAKFEDDQKALGDFSGYDTMGFEGLLKSVKSFGRFTNYNPNSMVCPYWGRLLDVLPVCAPSIACSL